LKFLESHIEALIFCASEPIQVRDIQACVAEMLDAEVPDEDIELALKNLIRKYDDDRFSFRIYRLGGGYLFKTKPEFQPIIGVWLKHTSKKQLSKAALETLAIIAYQQPITKGEIEQIRGVSSDYAVQKLLDKELIIIKGKADTVGRPVLYGTSEKFMEHFGINSLDELPQPKDFAERDIQANNES
jgi:segregation and condensation protein B